MNTETHTDAYGVTRYQDRLFQPWNGLDVEFIVFVVPGTVTCCENQGKFVTPDPRDRTLGVWLNNMSPDLTPLGQCGQCGTHVYPTATLSEDIGAPSPDWLRELANAEPCDYCGEKVSLERHDGDDICEPCYEFNDANCAQYTRRTWSD